MKEGRAKYEGSNTPIMIWTLFIDESGQDQRHSPYEVLAGIAVEDCKVWPLIRDLSDAQQHIFGMRLFEAYGREAKPQKLLDHKTYTRASQSAIHGALRPPGR